VSPARTVLIGVKPCGFRDALAEWVEGQGFPTFVTGVGREAVDWLRRTPDAVSFLDRDLDRVDGEEIWRVVRPIGDRGGVRRLVLLAERRTKELWLTALSDGVATVLPLPTERDVVLCALRLAARD
jgi:CheY-like chemotaxis protein